jgi:hypothetical protein
VSSWLTTTELPARHGAGLLALGNVPFDSVTAAASALGLDVLPEFVRRMVHGSLDELIAHVRLGGPRGAILDLTGDPEAGPLLVAALLPFVDLGGMYAVPAVDAPDWLVSGGDLVVSGGFARLTPVRPDH